MDKELNPLDTSQVPSEYALAYQVRKAKQKSRLHPEVRFAKSMKATSSHVPIRVSRTFI